MADAFPPRFRRTRSILVGASTGVLIGGGAGVVFLAAAMPQRPDYASVGLTPLLMVLGALPVVVGMAALVALPLATALVFLMTSASQRWRLMDQAYAWGVAGAAITLPLAYAVSKINASSQPFQLNGLTFSIFALGGLSGVAAWAARGGTGQSKQIEGVRSCDQI